MLERFSFFVIFVVLPGGQCAAIDGENELTLRRQNGTTIQASLIGIRSDRVTVSPSNSKPTLLSFDQILSLGNPSDQPVFDQVILRNGSVLVTIVKSVGLEQIKIESRLWNNKWIPTDLVKGIIFHPGSTETKRQIEIDAMMAATHWDVHLQLDNEDTVQGRLRQPDTIEQRKDRDGIYFEIREQPSIIAIEKTRSITFPGVSNTNGNAKDSDVVLSELGLTDGTLLCFDSLKTTADKVSIEIDPRFKLNANTMILGKSFWTRACFFRPSLNSVRYLSTEAPYRIVDNMENLSWKTKFNRSVIGGRLTIENYKTTKGIGTHAESQVVYLIRKNDHVFRCSVGIDQSANRFGDAICRIVLLNNENRWVPHSQTFAVTAGSAAKEISIDVSGYRAIGLITQKRNHGTVGDRVNWMDARMLSVK